MAMTGPRKPPEPSRPPSTALLPRGSSLANSAAATAPPRSPAPCCTRSKAASRLKRGSAHDLVGYFPRPHISWVMQPTNRGDARQYRPFLSLGHVPFTFPPVRWDLLWLTDIGALGSLWAGSCAPSQAVPKRGTRRSERNVEA